MTQNPFSVVILSKNKAIVEALLKSIHLYERQTPRIIVVTNGDLKLAELSYVQTVIQTEGKFVFSKSANIWMDAAGTDDVILVNDDVRLSSDQSFYRLRSFAYQVDRLGILSPLIDGWVGNLYQNAWEVKSRWPKGEGHKPAIIGMYGKAQVCFICVYLKRKMIDSIGPMDENYTGYGFEDNDYCMSARKAGWLTGITRHVVVKHGAGGPANNRGVNWSMSYAKENIEQKDVIHNHEYFMRKWFPEEGTEQTYPASSPDLGVTQPRQLEQSA